MNILEQAAGPGVGAVSVRHHRRISRQRAGVAAGALVFASVICVGFIALRHMFVGYASYQLLVWNLFLAWIPLVCSFIAYRFHVMGGQRRFLFYLFAGGWFLFFPNAPYLVTDFVHISPIHLAPEWLDVITVTSFAWTGLCLGYLSLYLMQEIARERLGRAASWLFVLVMLGLGSIGVFCGRVLRWNSWDVLVHPRWLLRTAHPIHRFSQPGDVVFVGTLFLFLLLSYCSLFALTHLYDRREPAGGAP
jgi:uncharacterized membrane protein